MRSLIPVLVALGLTVSSARAQLGFNLITESGAPIPGGPGPFSQFGDPSLDAGRVSFFGAGPSQAGVFTNLTGPITVVANRSTPIPSGGGATFAFNLAAQVTFDASVPTFLSGGFTGGGGVVGGIYEHTNGQLARIVDNNTPMPGGGGNFFFGGTTWISRSGSSVGFLAGSASGAAAGVYRSTSGALARVADISTPVPGGSGNFRNFEEVFIGGPNAYFNGRDSADHPGIYSAPLAGGPVSTVIDRNTPMPGGGTFTYSGAVSADGDNLALVGGTGLNNPSDLFARLNGSLFRIANTSTVLPGAPAHLDMFAGAAISGSDVVFTADSATFFGMYLWSAASGSITKILDSNDTLNGHHPYGIGLSPEGFEGNTVAFWMADDIFSGYQALYTVTIPAPGALGLLAAAGMLAPRRRR